MWFDAWLVKYDDTRYGNNTRNGNNTTKRRSKQMSRSVTWGGGGGVGNYLESLKRGRLDGDAEEGNQVRER